MIETVTEKSFEKTGGYISKITLNNGKEMDINKNDIVVFVGPNNAGKSQSLKDIHTLLNNDLPTNVIKDIELIKTGMENFKNLVEKVSSLKNQGSYQDYSGYGYQFNSYFIDRFNEEKSFGEARGLFVSFLDTESRLTISNPPEAINRDEAKFHPIHYVNENSEYRKKISESFKKAFGRELIPNMLFGRQIPLCMGDMVDLNSGVHSDEHGRLEAYSEILNGYDQVHNQGDGIRSFVGILLNLIIKTYCTYLIDEPESFLHPPQAKIMGHVIGELLDDEQQAFISTHSQEILKGLLEVCPKRIKIVRITRNGDSNEFSILDNSQFNEIWKDPLLKYSDIMSSLFHKSVVLCESDADCRLYSIILSHIKRESGAFAETLFIHCGGKHRMSKVISALKALNIDLIVIPDIDVLNDKNIIKQIVESCGDNWDRYDADYKKLVSNLKPQKNSINRSDINDILNLSQEKELSKEEIDQIKNSLKIESKWSIVKKGGKDSIPSGDGYSAFTTLDSNLRSQGIFLVPVGELENFIKEVGGHGPEWVNKVLESYSDLDNPVYHKITDFIKEWNC